MYWAFLLAKSGQANKTFHGWNEAELGRRTKCQVKSHRFSDSNKIDSPEIERMAIANYQIVRQYRASVTDRYWSRWVKI